MTALKLSDHQRKKVRASLRSDANAYVGSDENGCRRLVESALWMSRCGGQWRLLPQEYGHWNTVYKRFDRSCNAGVWEQMFECFAGDPDMENGMVDTTLVRAHACTAGAESNRRTS